MGTRRAALIHLRGAIGGGTEDDTTTPKLSSHLLERISPKRVERGIRKRQRMFLWTGRQAVFLLVMLVVCAMALAHPVWRHWYEMVFPPLCIIMAILALDYVMRN